MFNIDCKFSRTPEFLEGYSADLKRGLAHGDTLTIDDQRWLLASANEVLGLIASEWGKCEAVMGNHLRLAMVERLQNDLREVIRDLVKQPFPA